MEGTAPFADLADRTPHLFKQAIRSVETRRAPVMGMARSGNVGLSYALNTPVAPLGRVGRPQENQHDDRANTPDGAEGG